MRRACSQVARFGSSNPLPTITQLHPQGPVFADPSGAAVRVLLRDAFVLPRKWLNGETLDAFVEETHDLGFIGVRVFLQHAFMDWPQVLPFTFPIDRLAELVDWLAERGLLVELTVLADTQDTYWDDAGQPHTNPLRMTLTQEVDRVRAVLDRVRAKANIVGVELKNEPAFNGGRTAEIIDALQLPRAGDVPTASGDYDIIGHESTIRVLTYFTNHIQREPDLPSEAGKDGHFIYEGWQDGFRGTKPAPVAEDEPDKYGEHRGPPCGDDPNRPWVDDAEDTAAGFALSSAWFTFHSETGIWTQPFAPRERRCAVSWLRGAGFFPAITPTCVYSHDGLSDHPLEPTTQAGEVVSRLCGDRAYVAAAQPTASYQAVPKPGWTIVRINARGNLLELVR